MKIFTKAKKYFKEISPISFSHFTRSSVIYFSTDIFGSSVSHVSFFVCLFFDQTQREEISNCLKQQQPAKIIFDKSTQMINLENEKMIAV